MRALLAEMLALEKRVDRLAHRQGENDAGGY